MHTLGHFDIYGCALAIVLLLIPARSIAYVLLAALFSVLLILVHHIHLLMYVPTIATIVLLRYYLVQGINRQNAITSGSPRSPPSARSLSPRNSSARWRCRTTDFVRYLRSRMTDPSRENLLGFSLHLVPAASEGDCATPGPACRRTSWASRCSRC